MSFEASLRKHLVALLGEPHVKDDPITCYSYQADGLTLHPAKPLGVLFPGNTQELQTVIHLLNRAGIAYLARGAGTGLSGGAIPQENCVIIEMFRFREISDIDLLNRTITVGPGVVNIHVTQAVADKGFCFVPDPSSQKACTIGGNVAENSGGPHTLKYGVTVNHVLALKAVLPDGSLVQLGGPSFGEPGPDLLGLFIGSEGTFGIVTEVTCRLTPLPERVMTMLAVFSSVADACRSVSAMIASGLVPAALEMIDKVVIDATERTNPAGFPRDAEAVLIIELEDLDAGMEDMAAAIEALCRKEGAGEVRHAKDEAERARIWSARKGAFGAIGAISPSFYTQDGVIPRSALPQVLEKVLAIGASHGLIVANVFHAGDGNLHPLILYNAHDPKEVDAVHEAGKQILEVCIAAGGSLSGEHGIGLEKAHLMDLVYNAADLDHMQDVRKFFNPNNALNPGKIFATPGRCGEVKMVRGKSGISV